MANRKQPAPTPAEPIPWAMDTSFLKNFDITTIPAIFAIPPPAPEITPNVRHRTKILGLRNRVMVTIS